MDIKIKKLLQNKKIKILFVVLILAMIFSSIGVVYARYILTYSDGGGLITSNTMYFESDYLKSKGASYTISSTSFSFRLMNYPDQFRTSELDVNFTVRVDDPNVTISTSSGRISADQQNEVKITLSGLERGKTYTVTATGQNGYKKTLTATFTVTDEENNAYKHITQTEYYVLLTVRTEKVKGEATIKFPEGLIPDNTDSVMSGVTSTQGEFKDSESFQSEYSSRTYRFFKEDVNVNYTVHNFDAIVGLVIAESE